MNAKENLIAEVTKRIRTTFIGALASLEESHFGRLRDKEGWDQEFDRLRTEILDKGNLQLKKLIEYIENLQVAPARKYKYDMPMKNPYNRKDNYNG